MCMFKKQVIAKNRGCSRPPCPPLNPPLSMFAWTRKGKPENFVSIPVICGSLVYSLLFFINMIIKWSWKKTMNFLIKVLQVNLRANPWYKNNLKTINSLKRPSEVFGDIKAGLPRTFSKIFDRFFQGFLWKKLAGKICFVNKFHYTFITSIDHLR